jgi:hypothetical protein
MNKFVIGAVIVLSACGKNAPTDTIRQTIAEARTKPEVQIQIRLVENDLPNADALALRRRIEDQIEQQHVGTVVSDGSDVGHLDIRVQVDNTVSAIPRIQKILDTAGILSRSSIKIAEAR